MTVTGAAPIDGSDEEYLAWNTRVALFWLTQPVSGTEIYLTVTPQGLAAAAWECNGVEMSPDVAEGDFLRAVRGFYKRRVLQSGGDMASLARLADARDAPICLAFLALAVLAAYRMHADERNRATAYYPRLAELLECDVRRGLPAGFSKQGFEELWRFVRAWMEEQKMTPLFLPTEKVYRRYEQYPLAHAVLRQVDVDRLPDFFEWAGYGPASAVAPDRLREDLVNWSDGCRKLTRQGLAACHDVRVDAVVQEVAQELKAWNGAARDEEGRRIAAVELSLDRVRGIPELAYLARRPPGFPAVFDDGAHRFDALEDGWYDPITVPPDEGDALLRGLEWESRSGGQRFVLRRAGTTAIAFVRSENYTGWTSRRRLLAGVDCAVLCHESVAPEVEQRVADLIGKRPRPDTTSPPLPRGWRLLSDIKVERPTDVPLPGMEALEVDAAVELMATGGLRVGRKASWLLGAGPALFVSGVPQEVRVDGREVKVRTGKVLWDHLCREPGVRVVQAGATHRRYELVEPVVSSGLLEHASAGGDHYVVPLDRGHWILLGATPGERIEVDMGQKRGLARSPFDPIWAVRSGKRGCIFFVGERGDVAPRSVAHMDAAASRRWAESILQGVERQFPLAAIDQRACPEVARAWENYVRQAQRLADVSNPGSRAR